jgi:hypothetical protein
MQRFEDFALVDPESGEDPEGDDWHGGSDNDEAFQEIEREPAFEDIMRSSTVDDCGGLNMMEDEVGDMRKLTPSPLERFKLQSGAIAYGIVEDKVLDLDMNGRNALCRVADLIDPIRYLNPTAYVLGYIATNGTSQIDATRVRDIFNYLPRLRDDSVMEHDVVRYARYWAHTLHAYVT